MSLLSSRGLALAAASLSRPAARSAVRLVHTEKRIADLGIVLPPPGLPKANYTIACFESPTMVSRAPCTPAHA